MVSLLTGFFYIVCAVGICFGAYYAYKYIKGLIHSASMKPQKHFGEWRQLDGPVVKGSMEQISSSNVMESSDCGKACAKRVGGTTGTTACNAFSLHENPQTQKLVCKLFGQRFPADISDCVGDRAGTCVSTEKKGFAFDRPYEIQ